MFKIACSVRPSRYGDQILSLPILNYLEKLYPGSYKMAYIDKSCAAIAPLLLNQPLIDRIQISAEKDKFNINELTMQYDVVLDPYPQVSDPLWFNKQSMLQTTFELIKNYWGGYINPAEYDKLTLEERLPKLNCWFDVSRRAKTIALFPFSGYSNDPSIAKRSPAPEWWEKLVDTIAKDFDYRFIQFGHPESRRLKSPFVIDMRQLSLFDMVKEALACDLSISTDSGSAHILGAYGAKQIVVYTNYMENHVTNFTAFLPVNWKNDLIGVFGSGGINNCSHDEVINSIVKLQ